MFQRIVISVMHCRCGRNYSRKVRYLNCHHGWPWMNARDATTTNSSLLNNSSAFYAVV